MRMTCEYLFVILTFLPMFEINDFHLETLQIQKILFSSKLLTCNTNGFLYSKINFLDYYCHYGHNSKWHDEYQIYVKLKKNQNTNIRS